MSNKIFVTGSEGFIGSHLMKKLGKRGIGFDIKDKHLPVDITTKKGLREIEANIKLFNPKAIVHLAAISSLQDVEKNPKKAFDTNIFASYKLMKLAEKYNIPIIVASSAAVLEPLTSLYAYSKKFMEDYAKDFSMATCLRFYNVYGKGSKSVVNLFTDAISKKETIHLNGETSRDYVYVDDVVKVILKVINEKKKDKLYFVGTGISTTLMELVDIISDITNLPAYIEQRSEIKEIQHSLCLEDLEYTQCNTTLKEGIKKLLKSK